MTSSPYPPSPYQPGAYAPPPVPASPSPAMDQNGVLAADLPCRKCGQNLRGLYVAGRCPECGTPVGVSVRGPLLRFSDPAFVETLARGVNCILFGIIAVIAVVVVAMGLGMARADPRIIQLVSSFLGLASGALFVVGGWFLTTPDPSGIGEVEYGTARRVIRVTLIVGLFNSLLSFLDQLSTPPVPVHQAITVIAGLASLAGLVGQIAQMLYLSRLAMRIPDAALSARARFLMWALGISYGLVIILGIAVALMAGQFARAGAAGAPAPAGAAVGLGCGAAIFGLAAIVFGVMYLFMLIRFGRAFTREAGAARQVWSAAGAGAAGAPPVAPA